MHALVGSYASAVLGPGFLSKGLVILRSSEIDMVFDRSFALQSAPEAELDP